MRCKSCNKSFTPRYQESFCDTPGCKEAVLEAAYKKKVEKAQQKSSKQKLVPKVHHVSKERLLEVQINTLIKSIDYGQRCISCGEYRILQAGHNTSVGANVYLRYHLMNIWGQCEECNTTKGGNPEGYKIGIRNVGLMPDDIMMLSRMAKPLKLTESEFNEAISNLRMINKFFEKERVLSPKERIDVRKELNLEIGIYDF
jgi:hypothetical protein